MNKEAKKLVKKTAKIAGVTCIAASAVALMTTGAALKALTEGTRYLKDTVQKIIDDSDKAEIIGTVPAEAPCAEEVTEESATSNPGSF